MPQDCKTATLKEVLKFFVEEIDGMGIHKGPVRNLGLPGCWEGCDNWEFCELTENEFIRLLVPDGKNVLIGEKDFSTDEGSSRVTTLNYLEKKNKGEDTPPLIVRKFKLSNEREDASFYIEDGAHRAIAAKLYFQNHEYKPIKAYIRNISNEK